MEFRIVVKHERRNIRLLIKRVYLSSQLEKYDVIARNTSLTIQSNRPLLRGKGLKRKPDYKLIAGTVHNRSITENIIETIHQYLKANP